MGVLSKAAASCGLEPGEAEKTIESAFDKPRMPRADDEPESVEGIVDRLAQGGKKVGATDADAAEEQPVRPIISNVVTVWAKDKPKNYAVPINIVSQTIRRVTGDWPKLAGGLIFSEQGEIEGLPTNANIRYLNNCDSVFAWMFERACVRWAGNRTLSYDEESGDVVTLPSKGEFYEHLKEHSGKPYESAELLPHEPSCDGIWYVSTDLPAATGKALEEFAQHLNPETELDRSLMVAALATCFWGGPPGRRPAFVFTSDHGRASGKTETALMISRVAGGAITIDESEDWENAKSRLLSDESLSKRCILIDNLKKKMSRGSIEGAITAPYIDGKRMYHGQFTRTNRLTWLITANAPVLSRDLAQRSVIIKIGGQCHGTDFVDWVDDFFENKRAALISDVLALLRSPDQSKIEMKNRDRWWPWARAVLTKFPNGDALAQHVANARPAVDIDLQDADVVLDVVHQLIARMTLNPNDSRILISKKQMHKALMDAEVIDQKFTVRGMSSMVNQLCDVGEMVHLKPHKPTRFGSTGVQQCWQWRGPECPDDAIQIKFDPVFHRPIDAVDASQDEPGEDEETTLPF